MSRWRHDGWSGRWPARWRAGLAARLAGADRLRFAEAWTVPLLSFTPQVTAAAWVSALLLPGAGPAVAAAAAGAALTVAVGPRAVPHHQPPAAGPVLRVLTANLLAGRAAAGAVVELARRQHADVLFVQELTGGAAARLGRAGLGDLLPHQVTQPVRHGAGAASTPVTRCAAGRPLRRSPPSGAPRGLTSRPGSPCSWPAYTRRRRSRPGPRVPRPGGAVSCPRCPRPVTVRASWPETSTPPSITRSSAGSCAAATWTPPARRATGCPLPGDRDPAGARPCSPSTTSSTDRRCAVLTTSAHRLTGSDHRALYAEVQLRW